MTNNWRVYPPLTYGKELANISVGSKVCHNFDVIKHPPELEDETSCSLHWTSLSYEDMANLRNLANSDGLQKLIKSYGYGTSIGAKMTNRSDMDARDAEFYLTISSFEDIPETALNEIISFVKNYEVQ